MSETTIIIKTDNAGSSAVVTAPDVQQDKPKKKRRNKSSYSVWTAEILYALADARLLHFCHGVIVQKGTPTFFFDKVPAVKDIILQYRQRPIRDEDEIESSGVAPGD